MIKLRVISQTYECIPCRRTVIILVGIIVYFIATLSVVIDRSLISSPASNFLIKTGFLSAAQRPSPPDAPTNLSHLVFGIIGSEQAWALRKSYIESWWKPNHTRGLLFLDKPPNASLLPWPGTSPPYRVSKNLTSFLNKSDVRAQRMVHGIMDVFEEENENLRWLVMGDDDTIFFVDNIVDVVAGYDHRRYYYLGGHSETVLSNYFFSFNQAFGGGGIILSYPLAKALSNNMRRCLRRYSFLSSADNTTRSCIADIGVNLSPHRGTHQIDLHGDISGLLSSHPKTPLMSLHHFEMVDPIFPSMDRIQSTRHLMTAAESDQSRLLQQTICHQRQRNWSVSVSWGYSAQIYERIMPRSYLQVPVETFKPWITREDPPEYLFNTRKPSTDPCEAPHLFFFESLNKSGDGDNHEILSRYDRAWPRAMPSCLSTGNHSADGISIIYVFSPAKKRVEMDRCECCDIVGINNNKMKIKFRECMEDEIIA